MYQSASLPVLSTRTIISTTYSLGHQQEKNYLNKPGEESDPGVHGRLAYQTTTGTRASPRCSATFPGLHELVVVVLAWGVTGEPDKGGARVT